MGFLTVSKEFIHKIIEILVIIVDAIFDLFTKNKEEEK